MESLTFFWACASLLAWERLVYVFASRRPREFELLTRTYLKRGPIETLQKVLVLAKLIQLAVFLAWWYRFGGGRIEVDGAIWRVALAVLVVGAGQSLNLLVFVRLGPRATFFGNRFGMRVERIKGFPFSVFSHPQYLGTVVTIWAMFWFVRWPHPDWWVLPALETAYYYAATRWER